MVYTSIAFIGRGGQGIVFAATLLGEILFKSGYYVAQLQSYGAEVRGGSVIAYVVYGREPIENPFIEGFDYAIVLHEDGLKRWREHISRSKTVYVDSELVKTRLDNMVETPLSRVAMENNVYDALNVVGVGLIHRIALKNIPLEVAEEVIKSKKRSQLNLKAYKLGYRLAIT